MSDKNFVNTGGFKVLAWLTFICAAMLVIGSFTWLAPEEVEIPEVDVPTAAEIASQITIPMPVIPTAPEIDTSKIDAIYDEVLEDEVIKQKAEELVLDELGSKDFKQQLQDVLNDEISEIDFEGHDQYGTEIESWRDFEEPYSIDVEEVSLEGDDAIVEVEFKIKYVLDGDEDEDLGKAKLTVFYFVEELDRDENFADAEVDEEFEVDAVKLYG